MLREIHMSNLSQTKIIAVVMAIIEQDGKYLMQLRDDIPNIVHPGVWGFFGGHMEPGEVPEAALKRELLEEINYLPVTLTEFRSEEAENYLRHIFSCSLTVPVTKLELNEGWDLKLVTPAENRAWLCLFRSRDRETSRWGAIHQQIMLDFIDNKTIV